MAEVGADFVSIVPSAKGFGKALDGQIGGDIDASGKKAGKGFGSALKVGALAALGGAALLGGFLKSAIGEARESQKVGAVTAQVIKSTGAAAKVTAGQVGDLATAISNKTGIDDEAIQSGANLLLTFKNIKNEAGKGNDIFNQTTSIMTDMATAMGQEPKAAAIQLGKALNDPIKGIAALGRVGVTFSDSQKETIKSLVKSGDVMGAQKIILKELQSEFGGTAAAAATAGEKFTTTFGNFKEAIGTALLPILDKALGGATRFTTFLMANMGPAFDAVGRFVQPAVAGVKGFLSGLSGSGGGALSGLVDSVKGFGVALVGAAKSAGPALVQIGKFLLPLAGTAVSLAIAATTKAFGLLGPVVKTAGDALAGLGDFFALMSDHMTTVTVIAGVIGTLLIPKFITLGVQALLSAGKQVAAWVMTQAAAVTGAATSVVSSYKVVAGWVAAGAAAVVSGAQTVAIWALYAAEAIKGAATFVVQVGRVVAGWVLMGVQSLLAAAKVAAAWLIAIGPIGLVIAAVVGLVVLIVKNWDTIKAATVAAWNAVVGFVSSAWGKIKAAVSAAVSAVIDFVKSHWGLIVSIIGGPLAAIVVQVIKHWDEIKSAFSTGISKAVELVKALPGKILSALGDLGSLLIHSGEELMRGLARGIGNLASAPVDAVKGVASKIKGLFGGSPVEWGPLLGWNNGGAGKNLIGLLAKGLEATGPVDRAMLGLASGIASTPLTPSIPGLSVPFAPAVRAGGGGVSRATAAPYPSVLEVRDVDGVLLGRMRVEGQRVVAAHDEALSALTVGS